MRLTVKGACYRGEADQDLSAIQQFGQQMKQNPAFFKGFATAWLDEITEQTSTAPEPEYTYRTFEYNCESERVL